MLCVRVCFSFYVVCKRVFGVLADSGFCFFVEGPCAMCVLEAEFGPAVNHAHLIFTSLDVMCLESLG